MSATNISWATGVDTAKLYADAELTEFRDFLNNQLIKNKKVDKDLRWLAM
jgi:hypothetical protein